MITACVLTLGCRVNQYESDYIMEELKKSGVSIVSFDTPADIYVINTCSVTGESDRKSRQLIRRCASKNPSAVVIVTGCYSQIKHEEVSKIFGVDYVCGNNAKSQIPRIALELLQSRGPCVVNLPDIHNADFDVMKVGAPLIRTRAFIKIEDGCDSKCAYCIIPYARGSVRSNPAKNVIEEIKNVVSEGCYEVVLTGIETASYGKDFKNGYSLADLLCEVNKIEGLKRIRISSLDPASITREFVDKIKGLDKVMHHFHISMQSGCTKTLNRMKRKYNAQMAKASIGYLREAFPDLMLSADIITGFPQESEEEFCESYDFLKSERFLHLHIFPYSKREGTVASTMSGQVPDNIKKERLHSLECLEKSVRLELLNEFISKNESAEVLFESFDGEFAIGHTENFVEIKAPSKVGLSGKFLRVKLKKTDGVFVFGEIE